MNGRIMSTGQINHWGVVLVIDPWAPPSPAQFAELRAMPAVGPSAPWQQPSGMSLRSVPDARSAVPLRWWLPLIAVLMLGVTTVAILPGFGSGRAVLVAAAINIVGYALVWFLIRPRWLQVGPYAWPSIDSVAQDRTDPPTIALPVVRSRSASIGREWLLLLNSAAVGLGATFVWAVITGLLIHQKVPAVFRTRAVVRSVGGAFTNAVVNAALTSVLEECGIAVLILATAGLAQRFLPDRFDSRSVGLIAIVAATVVRTALHIPLWGVGAVARIGLSYGLAWLFWRTRRIWPLITVHILWDTLALQTQTSPSLQLRGWCALTVLAWGVTGLVITIIAIRRSRKNVSRAAHYYRTN